MYICLVMFSLLVMSNVWGSEHKSADNSTDVMTKLGTTIIKIDPKNFVIQGVIGHGMVLGWTPTDHSTPGGGFFTVRSAWPIRSSSSVQGSLKKYGTFGRPAYDKLLVVHTLLEWDPSCSLWKQTDDVGQVADSPNYYYQDRLRYDGACENCFSNKVHLKQPCSCDNSKLIIDSYRQVGYYPPGVVQHIESGSVVSVSVDKQNVVAIVLPEDLHKWQHDDRLGGYDDESGNYIRRMALVGLKQEPTEQDIGSEWRVWSPQRVAAEQIRLLRYQETERKKQSQLTLTTTNSLSQDQKTEEKKQEQKS